VLAADDAGLPVLLKNRLGEGQVVYALPLVEETIAQETADPRRRERWIDFYRYMLETA
jgi:hypothetical protein